MDEERTRIHSIEIEIKPITGHLNYFRIGIQSITLDFPGPAAGNAQFYWNTPRESQQESTVWGYHNSDIRITIFPIVAFLDGSKKNTREKRSIKIYVGIPIELVGNKIN